MRHETRVLQVTKTIVLFMCGKKKNIVKNLGKTGAGGVCKMDGLKLKC